MIRTSIVTFGIVAAFALAGCIQPGENAGGEARYPVPASATPISGSGSTFMKPLVETWGIEYQKLQPTIRVSYAGGGSGKGIRDITNKDVVYAGSDAPLGAAERTAAPGILHIPNTLGAVGVVYSAAGVPDGLRLDGPTLGKIYLGDVKRWNDPAIAAMNPGIGLPDAEIAVAYRSDSSGTTYAFTDYLAHASPEWAAKMGAAPSKKPDWTKSAATQLSGNGNDGVGSLVKTTPNAIGYVELAYVKSLSLPAVALKNKAGEFVAPTTDGASKAAAGAIASLPAADGDWSAVSIVDAEGAGAYPISTFAYILVYGSLSDYGGKANADEVNAVRNWLWYGLHEGQAYAETLGYAPLPPAVVAIGEAALDGMTV